MADRILLVDDDAIFRSEFAECFSDLNVLPVADGSAALQILRKPHDIDLVILDVKMAGMDGIEVLEQIKKLDPKLKVIIFTGYGTKTIAVDALRGRADDYIEKSLSSSSVRETLERHLEVKERDRYGAGIEGKIARVKNFLERNCHKRIVLEDAARLVCLTPKYLSRVFGEHVKKGFNEYAISLKMEKAKGQLLKTGNTVEQISSGLGYSNPESFIRQFKKLFRLTPSAYRDKMRRKDGSGKINVSRSGAGKTSA